MGIGIAMPARPPPPPPVPNVRPEADSWLLPYTMATVSTSPASIARKACIVWNSKLDPPVLDDSSQRGVSPRYSASITSCIPP